MLLLHYGSMLLKPYLLHCFIQHIEKRLLESGMGYMCTCMYEGGSESSVIGVITLLINIIGCCILP